MSLEATGSERPLASPGPILLVAGIALLAIAGLILSLFRNPGLPAYVEDSYMRVAGGLVAADVAERDSVALSKRLSEQQPGLVRVPALDAQGFHLEGGTHVKLGKMPAAIAIFHNSLRDLVVWHGVAGQAADLPPAPNVRRIGGREFLVHYKATTTIVFWQDGPLLVALSSTLPAEQVMELAQAAASVARP